MSRQHPADGELPPELVKELASILADIVVADYLKDLQDRAADVAHTAPTISVVGDDGRRGRSDEPAAAPSPTSSADRARKAAACRGLK